MIDLRIKALRKAMSRAGVDAYIIRSSDPHQTELVAPHWKSREWLTGFLGSAGTAVVTADHAVLWADSRYYIQAEEETADSMIEVFRLGMPEVPGLEDWLLTAVPGKSTVALEGECFTAKQCQALRKKLTAREITLNTASSILEKIWTDRPPLPEEPAKDHHIDYAGTPRQEKLATVRKKIEKSGADSHLITKLDDIAWTLNIRGDDIEHCPLVISYLWITSGKCTWFVDPGKVPAALTENLREAGVGIQPYSDINTAIKNLTEADRLLLDPGITSQAIFDAVPANCLPIKTKSPVPPLKSIKCGTELDGARAACRRDCAAVVKFLAWLESNLGKSRITEATCMEKLGEFRSGMDLFQDISFAPIVAYQANGALCHYRVEEDTAAELNTEGLLLIDSGGHYSDGTTDTTRTIALGPLTQQQREDYTLVLKSHINLDSVVFHEDTRGRQLDSLARTPMWKYGRHFKHGAGHGIGSYLNVHEGPAGLGGCDEKLREGMIITNEPGLYREGSHGIRIENMVTVVLETKNEFGQFNRFETLTYLPIDLRPIIPDLLSADEHRWLKEYHERTVVELTPFLTENELEWLKEAVKPQEGMT